MGAPYIEKHKKGGRTSKFTIHEMMILFLIYVKNYSAMEDYAFEFKVSKSTICTKFDNSEDRQIDITEIRIERPKYNQKSKYSGKKKYHTMKIQIIRSVETGFIYEIEVGLGAEYDFHLSKRIFEGTTSNVTYEVDLGYLGMDKIHKNSKYHKLTEEEIKENKELAKERIFIEHIHLWIKRFKILPTRFRNHLSYFAKFAVLLCGFYNFDRA